MIAIASAFNDSIGKWLVLGTVLSMAATFVLVVVLLRSIVMPLFLVLPLVVGIFITMAIMHVVGVPMDSNMTTALAIASGVGIDSEVYLLFRSEKSMRCSVTSTKRWSSRLPESGVRW